MSKKAVIVPGVHDSLPVGGRFTIELLHPDTGRVRKQVRCENAVMDWVRKNVAANGGRGMINTSLAHPEGYDSFNPMQDLLPGNPASFIAYPDSWPTAWPPSLYMQWLWATNQNVAPDSTLHHIPTGDANGEVTAGVNLNVAFAPDGVKLKRGGVQLASCLRTWNRTRIVAEFGLAYGNGIYRSLGLGTLIQERLGPGMRASCPGIASISPTAVDGNYSGSSFWNSTEASNGMDRGCVDFEDGGYWGLAGGFTGLGRVAPGSGGNGALSVTQLVSLANMPGSGGQLSVAVNGSDFWIGRNQALYRCVKPVSNVAITVTDTYDLSATLGAQTILDIAVDRVGNRVFLLTSTHVHVINGASGAPISNFAHSHPNATNEAAIEWDRHEELIFISFTGAQGSTDGGFGDRSGSGISSYPNIENVLVRGFTTAGAAGKNFQLPQYGVQSGSQAWYSAPYFALSGSGIALSLRLPMAYYPNGPSMATHALLGADVEKTAADGLRITYDFDWV